MTRPLAARDVPVGSSWAFRDHRSQAEVYRGGAWVQPMRSPKPRKFRKPRKFLTRNQQQRNPRRTA